MSYLKFLRTLLIFFFLVGNLVQLSSQNYYTLFQNVYDIELNLGTCSTDEVSSYCCPAALITGFTFTHDSLLIVLGDDWLDNDYLWLVNQTTGEWTTYFTLPPSSEHYRGLVSVGNGIFYTTHAISGVLFELNVNNGTSIALGALEFP